MSKWRVTIERSDGRRHYATVTQVHRSSELISVEWNEDGQTMSKEEDFHSGRFLFSGGPLHTSSWQRHCDGIQVSFQKTRELNKSFDARLKATSLDSSGNVKLPTSTRSPRDMTDALEDAFRSRTRRRHYATVVQIESSPGFISVEWQEDGTKMTKEVSFEKIRELNPSFDARLQAVSLNSSGFVLGSPNRDQTDRSPPMKSRSNDVSNISRPCLLRRDQGVGGQAKQLHVKIDKWSSLPKEATKLCLKRFPEIRKKPLILNSEM